MAGNNTIKIDADFKSVTKGFETLGKELNKVAAKKVSIGIDDKRFKEAIKFQQDVLKNTEKEIKRVSLAMSEAFDPKKVEQYRKQIQLLKEDYKQASDILKGLGGGRMPSGSGGSSGGSGGGGFLGALGMGGIASKLGIAGIIASAVYGLGKTLIGPAFSSAGSRIGLRGLGGLTTKQIQAIERGGVELGYSGEESRSQAYSLMRSTGGSSSLRSLQMLSRGTGIGVDELIGFSGNLRQAGVSEAKSARMLKEILTDAIGAGFDSSRVGDFLSSFTQYVGGIAQSGDVNVNSVRAIFDNLMSGSTFFNQNSGRSLNAISAINEAFTSSGPNSMFAIRALRKLSPDMSTADLFYNQRAGMFNAPNSTPLYRQFISEQLSSVMGKNIKAGGGLDQLNSDQLSMASVLLGKNNSLDVTMMREVIKGVLDKDQGALDRAIGDKIEAQKSLQERTMDVLASQDNKLLSTVVILDTIKQMLADFLLSFGDSTMGKMMGFPSMKNVGGYNLSPSMQRFLGVTGMVSNGKFNPMTSTSVQNAAADLAFNTNAPNKMRVDRHNNPIANVYNSTEFQKILTASGIPFYKGDSFNTGSGTLNTMGFNNPMDGYKGASAILSKSKSAWNWYTRKASYSPQLWNVLGKYGVQTQEDFANLSQRDKFNIIQKMAQFEGTQGKMNFNATPNLSEDDKQSIREIIKEFRDALKDKKSKQPMIKSNITTMLDVSLNKSEVVA